MLHDMGAYPTVHCVGSYPEQGRHDVVPDLAADSAVQCTRFLLAFIGGHRSEESKWTSST